MKLEADTKKLIVTTDAENEYRMFAIDVLDFINDMNRVASELGVDCCEYNMISEVQSLKRVIETQRRTIAELRKRPKAGRE